jgi:hypothetical protein
MHENRWQFRFGLVALFALVAAIGVLASIWNPFIQPSSTPSLSDVKIGMSGAEVSELIGKPDTVEEILGVTITRYQVTGDEVWMVAYKDGRVYNKYIDRRIAVPRQASESPLEDLLAREMRKVVTLPPRKLPSSAPLLNSKTVIRQQD